MRPTSNLDPEMFRPFNTLLVANRGEIAVRIIKAAKAKGLETVAVFSEADADAPFVRHADRAVLIGPGPASQSYLNIDNILDAAAATGADAIHPGYGFLSENPEFARRVRAAGINFIGPRAGTIESMGDKALARSLALKAGLNCPPSFDDPRADDAMLGVQAERIGYPVMVKAVAGGGGRGIRKVDRGADLADALSAVRQEAMSAFGRSELCLEKYVANGRHIEIQVVCDGHGGAYHIGERDCSIQRRHQKLVEETPSPAVGPDLRRAMATAAVNLARSVDYVGVGTVEFMLAENGDFYFLEVNPRLQVEHPVTELAYGVDIVGLQLDIARGQAIEKSWPDDPIGAAIEVRLLAEDAGEDFSPQTGTILGFAPSGAEGVRVDHGLEAGTPVPLFYDSMIAKVIAHGRDRNEARSRLARALKDTRTFGLCTIAGYLRDLVQSPDFASGVYSTEFLNSYQWRPSSEPSERTVALCALFSVGLLHASGKRGAVPSFNAFFAGESRADFVLDGDVYDTVLVRDTDRFRVKWKFQEMEATILDIAPGRMRVRIGTIEEDAHFAFDGSDIFFTFDGHHGVCKPYRKSGAMAEEVREVLGDDQSVTRILAPMSSVVCAIPVKEGDLVEKQGCVISVEAMKMVHHIFSPRAGVVRKVLVEMGQSVNRNQLMIELEGHQPG